MKKLTFLLSVLVLFLVPAAHAQTTCAKASCTVVVKWVPSVTAGVTQNVYRETSAGACALTSTGSGPGCLLLTATPLSNTVTSFSDTVGSVCSAASTTCAPPGTYSYVIRSTDSSGTAAQAETNAITVSLPPSVTPVTGQSATVS